ncbi:MAG: lipopolysaccharide biosynthesis protein [Actinomycetota bacterium]
MSIKRQAARGVFWSAAGNWGYQLSTFVVFVVLSRLLTPAAFGTVAIAIVFTTFTRVLTEQGLADAIVQRPSVDRRQLDTAFWANVGVATILMAALMISARPIAGAFDDATLAPVLWWLSLTLPISSLQTVQRALLQKEMAFASLTLRSVAANVAGGAAGITAALAGMGVWALVIQDLTGAVVNTVTIWAVADWRPGFTFSKADLKSLSSFGVHVLGFKVLQFFTRRSDDLLIGYFLGSALLGLYTVAYRLLRIMINVTTNVIGAVAFPVFSRIQEQREKVQRAYYKSIGLTSFLAFPAFVGVMVTAPQLVPLIFGAKWIEAVPVMQILSFAGLLEAVLHAPGVAMKALGKPSWRLAIAALTTVVTVAGFLISVRWGIVAVATAFVVINYLLSPITLRAAHRLIGADGRVLARHVFPPLAASVGMALAIAGLKLLLGDAALWIQVVVYLGAGAAVYLGLIRLIDRRLLKEAVGLVRLALPSRPGS